MNSFSPRRLGLAWFAVAMLMSGSAEAVVALCPNTVATTDREFSLDTTPGASCLLAGNGSLTGVGDAVNALPAGYFTLDKTNDTTTGILNGSLSITGAGTVGGTFSISAAAIAGHTSLVLALQVADTGGGGAGNPDWAAFLLPVGLAAGNWAIINTGGLTTGLGYAILYATPLPGALPLFATGLGMMGWLRWRRRRRLAAN